MKVEELKEKVNKNKNKNTRFVKIKEDRNCKMCGKSLKKGTICLTTNKKGKGRSWYCDNCVMQLLSEKDLPNACCIYHKIMSVKAEMNNVAFGDECAVYAYMDILDKYEAECFNCSKCEFAELL